MWGAGAAKRWAPGKGGSGGAGSRASVRQRGHLLLGAARVGHTVGRATRGLRQTRRTARVNVPRNLLIYCCMQVAAEELARRPAVAPRKSSAFERARQDLCRFRRLN